MQDRCEQARIVLLISVLSGVMTFHMTWCCHVTYYCHMTERSILQVHERHLHGDLLLGILKGVVERRPEIRVVLMSATMNLQLFKSYLPGTKIQLSHDPHPDCRFCNTLRLRKSLQALKLLIYSGQ